MKKHVLADWPDSHFTDFLVTLALVKLQIKRIPRVEYHTPGMLIDRTPVVHRLE
ncbi:hypothetical protein D3C78_1395410 [compost metagenome]